MKKILIVLLAGALISCGKNYYKEMAEDMGKIIAEEKEVIEKIDPIYNRLGDIKVERATEKTEEEYLADLKAIDIENIRKQNEAFKKKYEKVKLEPKTIYEQACKEAQTEYSKFVDGYLNMYEKHRDGALAGQMQFSWPMINLMSNTNSQEGFLKSCELAGNNAK